MPTSQSWKSVTYGKGTFVAIASDANVAAYSNNGINWTSAALPSSAPDTSWISVTYGKGRFVAIKSTNSSVRVIAYSDTGSTWTFSTDLPSNAAASWRSITYGKGKFVAISTGSNKVVYSSDGVTWTLSATGLPSSSSWYNIKYGAGRFVIVGFPNVAAYSDNGITWYSATLPSSESWYALTYGEGWFTAIAYNSTKVAYSIDKGATWNLKTNIISRPWSSLTYGRGRLIGVSGNLVASTTSAYSTRSFFSSNNWQEITLPTNWGFAATWTIFADNSYVSITNGGWILKSSDAVTWSMATVPSSSYFDRPNPGSMAYGAGRFITTDTKTTNRLLYSDDAGSTWTLINPLTNNANFKGTVVYGEGRFVAGVSGVVTSTGIETGYIMSSTNGGLTWGTIAIPFTNPTNGSSYINRLCYGNGIFVAVGYVSSSAGIVIKINSSVDGSSIGSSTTLPSSFRYPEIAFGGGRFVVIGNSTSNPATTTTNNVAYSDDGITWIVVSDQMPLSTQGTKIVWTSITYGEGRFVASGLNTNILAISNDGINWTALTIPITTVNNSSVCYGAGKFLLHSYKIVVNTMTKQFYRMTPTKQ